MIDTSARMSNFLTGTLTTLLVGEDGEPMHFICRYFGREHYTDRLFLAGLPIMIKIDIPW